MGGKLLDFHRNVAVELTKKANLANLAKNAMEPTMQYTVHAAKTNLSKLIAAALAGEEVIIAKRDKPVVKLVAISQRKFKIGILEGKLKGPGPDFFEPMDEEDLKLWEGGD